MLLICLIRSAFSLSHLSCQPFTFWFKLSTVDFRFWLSSGGVLSLYRTFLEGSLSIYFTDCNFTAECGGWLGSVFFYWVWRFSNCCLIYLIESLSLLISFECCSLTCIWSSLRSSVLAWLSIKASTMFLKFL